MAKFDPKLADLNKDGVLSNYEENVGKKRAEAMQMAGSKGTFAMQMNKQKNNSADNFSSKDSATMMQSALYNSDPDSDTDPNKLKGYTGSENIDKSKSKKHTKQRANQKF
jgi:hypothetical protein